MIAASLFHTSLSRAREARDVVSVMTGEPLDDLSKCDVERRITIRMRDSENRDR